MAIWAGLGFNYGHNFTTANYDTALVESDLIFLKSQGINKLRIVFPAYNGTMIANCQDMVLRALAHGFYVIWGVATGVSSPNLTATIWTAYKPYVTGTLAPWAQANGLSELALGNECDFQVDGTTLLASTVRADVRSMCSTVKSGGYTGVVSYDTAATTTIVANWATDGLGTLDKIGWNNYNGAVPGFITVTNSIATDFGALGYMSEFGSKGGGYPDFYDENGFASDTVSRISAMQSAGTPSGYFFCYRDGAFGLGANTFGIVQTSGVARFARGAILTTPGQKIFSHGVQGR